MNKLFIVLPILSLLIVGSIIQFKKSNDIATSEDVFYQDLVNCQEHSFELPKPCQTTEEYKLAEEKFMELTNYSKGLSECQQFYDFQINISFKYPVNEQGYYEKCFFSSQVQSIVNSNSCFKTHFYYPLIVKCAGF